MKKRVKTVTLAVAMAAMVSCSTALAQSVQVLGDFRDWSAYSALDRTGKICFVISKPVTVDPEPDGYTQAYLYLTHRKGEGTRNEFNLVAGFDFADDTPALVRIGGRTFALFTEIDAAWLEEPARNGEVAQAMRAGSTLVIEATSARGIKVKETFSLSGATAASRAIDAACR